MADPHDGTLDFLKLKVFAFLNSAARDRLSSFL